MPEHERGIWWMRQTWSPTLFVHWHVPSGSVRSFLPQALQLDTWQGRAFVSLVVVDIKHARARGLPRLPGVSSYQQVNLRTYVSHQGRSGVFFLGAWLSKALPALAQSVGFGVPSRRVSVDVQQAEGDVHVRVDTGVGPDHGLALHAVVDGEPQLAREGSLEEWLHERYRAYAQRGRSLIRTDVRHRPWRLAPAHLDELAGALGDAPIPLREPTLVCIGSQSETHLLRPQRVERLSVAAARSPLTEAYGGQGA